MGEKTITVTIAGRQYRLFAEEGKEDKVLEAAARIEESVKQFAAVYAYKDNQDLLAMVALQFAGNSVDVESKLHQTQEEAKNDIDSLQSMLTDFLKKQNVL